MRRTPHGILAIALATLCSSAPTSAEEPAAGGQREPFASPLTPEEGRWLLDNEDAQRFRRVPAERLPKVAPRELPPQVRAIQDSLGGSLLNQFDALQPDNAVETPWWKRFALPPAPAGQPTPIWPDPSADSASPLPSIVPMTAEAPLASASAPVAALRKTAAELDDAANRLEELDLYRQSDALRDLAQQLRVDARRMTTSGADPRERLFQERPREPRAPRRLERRLRSDPPRRPSVGPVPDLATPPTDSADRTDPDAWNESSPQLPTPNAEH